MRIRVHITADVEVTPERLREKYGSAHPEAVCQRITEEDNRILREAAAERTDEDMGHVENVNVSAWLI